MKTEVDNDNTFHQTINKAQVDIKVTLQAYKCTLCDYAEKSSSF